MPVDFSVDGPRVTIVGGSARFTLPTMPVEDYPPLPEMPGASGTVDAATFAEAVAQTVIAAGRDDTLPMLTGIRVEIEGDRLTLAATDRFRLAVRELQWSPDSPNVSTAVLVHARTLADAAKTLGGASDVTISLGEGLLVTGFAFVAKESSVAGVVAMTAAFVAAASAWWIYFDHGERIAPLEKVRTASKALARLEELAVERAGDAPVDLAVQHLAAADKAEALAERLRARLPRLGELHLSEVGAVVGAHVGPGLLGVVVSRR